MQNNVLTSTPHTRQWLQGIIWGAIWWVLLTVGAFLWAAPAVRHVSGFGTVAVHMGPFVVAHITKIPAGANGGVTLSCTLQYGMIALAFTCIALQLFAFIVLPKLIWRRKYAVKL